MPANRVHRLRERESRKIACWKKHASKIKGELGGRTPKLWTGNRNVTVERGPGR